MSWLYLPGQVVDYLEANSSDSEPSAMWNIIPTASRSLKLAFTMGIWTTPRFGMMCEPSMASRGVEWWMSLLRDSHVSPSAWQGGSAEKKMNAMDGPIPQESLAKLDPDSFSWKTSQLSLLTHTLEPYSETWPRAGIVCDGIVYQLPPLAPLIKEIGFGYWPTPTTIPEAPNKGSNKINGPKNLGQVAKEIWPTPNASEHIADRYTIKTTMKHFQEGRQIHLAQAVKLWPTPQARDWKDGSNPKPHGRHSEPLGVQVGGSLNPAWVEWIMGWPIGWTDLKPLGMDKYQEWRQQHGGS